MEEKLYLATDDTLDENKIMQDPLYKKVDLRYDREEWKIMLELCRKEKPQNDSAE